MGFLENQTLTEHVFELVFESVSPKFPFLLLLLVVVVVVVQISKNKMFRDYYRFIYPTKKWFEISWPVCIKLPLSKGRFSVTWPSVITLPLQFTSRRQYESKMYILNSIMSMIMYLFSPKRCAVTRGNRETQVGETIAMLSIA